MKGWFKKLAREEPAPGIRIIYTWKRDPPWVFRFQVYLIPAIHDLQLCVVQSGDAVSYLLNHLHFLLPLTRILIQRGRIRGNLGTSEQFRQITHYLVEQFRQIIRYLAEQFHQIAHYLAEHLIQANISYSRKSYCPHIYTMIYFSHIIAYHW